MKRTAFISIVGRPNVGKSTLMNRILGEKVAIVSSKPQTTRGRIVGIHTVGDDQYVFLDTPGIHRPQNRLGDAMVRSCLLYTSFGVVGALGSIVTLALAIIGIVNAAQGKVKELPVIGGIKILQ